MQKLRIGILGSRGIPNAYGGFEQFAESLSLYLVAKGHRVSVYNSSLHENKADYWKGVRIIKCYDPEDKIGTPGQFIYDLNCIRHARKANFDILLQLGYTSSAIWNKWLPKKSIIITNMDGLEWKRSKYNRYVQRFLKLSESWAANSSDHLVADSIGIQEYLKKELGKGSQYIAYGASIFDNPEELVLKDYNVNPYQYSMLIARMEPENNIETILQGYSKSNCKNPFLVIGNYNKSYGMYLKSKFTDERIRFIGPVYNQNHLNNLRHHSIHYFHGHSVGGTNPSLLEAMASSSMICAHNNIFNKSILEENAHYFDSAADITGLVERIDTKNKSFVEANRTKIEEQFSEEFINSKYEELFMQAFNQK